MNRLERDCLNSFAAEYRRIAMKITSHDKYLDELIEEENRIRTELEFLETEKERLLTVFAEALLDLADKNRRQNNAVLGDKQSTRK